MNKKTFTTQVQVTIPNVTTDNVTAVTSNTAVSGGNVTSAGNGTVSARGVCWSTTQNPTISNSHTSNGSGTGTFASNITGLSANTTYYVRAYAINEAGTAYGEQKTFTTEGGSPNPPTWTNGILPGLFSISSSEQVHFSQGNLQYQASTNKWKFAEEQYDYICLDNLYTAQTYDGWIDLFGWGTSGYNHGAVCYQPWSTSQTNGDYYAYGNINYNLNNQSGKADWGYNAISNGGNVENQWRVLTIEEWAYVFNERSTNSGIRYAKANVTEINGVIILPDDWNNNTYVLNNTDTYDASFSSNTISQTDWKTHLEPNGAVFLCAAGYRTGGVGSFNIVEDIGRQRVKMVIMRFMCILAISIFIITIGIIVVGDKVFALFKIIMENNHSI